MSQDPSTTQLRNSLRRTFRERRQQLSLSERQQAEIDLLDLILGAGLLSQVKRLALYKTNDGELGTQGLIDYCWQEGIEVYLPVLHPFCDGYLLFLRYEKHSLMQANLYGIAEPKLDITKVCPIEQLDLLFTPLVAFDQEGNRLGMGGGYYDRTLASVFAKNKARPSVFGLAYDIQKTLSLPLEAWDLPLPAIITPSKIYRFSA